MDINLITVVIPTFNRSGYLKMTIEMLLMQTNFHFSIIVLDNCSTDNTYEIVKEFGDSRIQYFKNRVNIGATANFLRAIEYCNTEWVWLIGDDDQPLINSIENIYTDLQKYPELDIINYSSIYERPDEKEFKTIDAFLMNIDSYSNILFVSNNVFKLKFLLNYINVAYVHSNTMSPFFCMILAAREEVNLNIILSKNKIIINRKDQGIDDRWSHYNFNLGLISLLEISDLPKEILNITVEKVLFSHFIPLKLLFFNLLRTYYPNKMFTVKYIFYQTFVRYIPYSKNKIKYLVTGLKYLLILRNKKILNYYVNKNVKNSKISFLIAPLNNRI
jgi:glycosyltransferase involved in cell wall biosynthesis